MVNHNLWSTEVEKEFFEKTLRLVSPGDLFYLSDDGSYYAYWPKAYQGEKATLQSRNSYIGKFTEEFIKNLFSDYARSLGYFAVRDVICDQIGLTRSSPADVAFCKTDLTIQEPENIIVLFEVKMSIVWNWKYDGDEVICIGNCSTHQGTPSLLRSDSMLKAIGKAINIRISDQKAYNIPIIIIGNTPITPHYYEKVDNLKSAGIIQGFWSVNPNLTESLQNPLIRTDNNGFQTIQSYTGLLNELSKILDQKLQFFSSMMSRNDLGKIIKIACQEKEETKIAEKFLHLIGINYDTNEE